MEPRAKNIDGESQRAIAALKGGALVIVPTKTVYGLAADVNNPAAIAKLYALKQRPANQPISLLVADLTMAKIYGELDKRAEVLAKAFWPGAMTLIVPAKENAPLCTAVLAGGNTIGLRVPAHDNTRALIARYGRALAVPSANRAGENAPLSPREITPDILAGAALCLDDGACASGIASTLIDASGDDIRILRRGDLDLATIMQALGTAQNA